jgi:glycosyltransferase involved in cell wall biosynthesis
VYGAHSSAEKGVGGLAMISFLMMAKNVQRFIGEAIQSLQSESSVDWELLVVNDASEDETRRVAARYAREDSRIRVFDNPYSGKVLGTNFAYTQAYGSHIKCIDSDDLLLGAFFRAFERNLVHDVMYHSAEIVDEALRPITTYHPNSTWLNGTYQDVLEGLVSLPKFSWSFTREIADKVFPMPAELPFEDVWMSLLIKRHAKQPVYVRDTVYMYRQHGSQTFGGILNYSRAAVVFRSDRLLRLMDILEAEERVVGQHDTSVFESARIENRFLAGRARLSDLLKHDRLKRRVPRLLLIRYSPELAGVFAKFRWRMEGAKRVVDKAERHA